MGHIVLLPLEGGAFGSGCFYDYHRAGSKLSRKRVCFRTLQITEFVIFQGVAGDNLEKAEQFFILLDVSF
jgi:hypothetical protein